MKKVAGPPTKVSGTTVSKIPVPSTKTTTANNSSQIKTTNPTNTSTKASTADSNQKTTDETTSSKVTPQPSQLSNSIDQHDASAKPKTAASKTSGIPKSTKGRWF